MTNLVRWESLGRSPPTAPVVLSYFTDDFYLRDAHELVRSCLQFGIDYSVQQVPDLRSWERNTGHKPVFLLEQVARFPGRSVVWVDADARFRSKPVLFDSLRAVCAAHVWHRDPNTHELLSGTVFLGRGLERERLLRAWIAECVRNQCANDQTCLYQVVKKHPGFEELPASYCWIYDLMPARDHLCDPALDQDVVVEHYQSSRWSRKRALGGVA